MRSPEHRGKPAVLHRGTGLGVLCNRSSRGPEGKDRLLEVWRGETRAPGANITREHHPEVARQGQQGCSPRSILR